MEKFDKQTTGMAGELLAAGKIFKMGLQASLTFGNAKAIDLIVYNPVNEKNYNVQVKTSRGKTNFRELKGVEIKPEYIFVFIILNEFKDNEEYFILKGSELIKNANKFFGAKYNSNNLPDKGTVNWKALLEYKDKWDLFLEK